ncbi:hypothetical protein MTO96_033613 [Rhipicephalus appendiculatus]
MAKGGLFLPFNVYGLCLILVALVTISGGNVSKSEVPDAFMIFGQFNQCAGVRDVNRDPMFTCLRANRSEYDPDVPSTTYLWSLNAGKGKPRMYAVGGLLEEVLLS